jgi:hypothetical protein
VRVKEEAMRVKEVIMIRSTYWQYSVSITRQDGRRDHGIVCGGKPTFLATIADAITQASYYVSIGYTEVTIDLEEICALCCGAGQVVKPKRRGFGVRKTCPDCKGKSVANSVGPIPINLCADIMEKINADDEAMVTQL